MVSVKKNVLHLIPSFHQGGSERQAIQLACLLRDEGSYNISLACLDQSGILLDEVKGKGFEDVPEFPLTSFYDANMIRQLKKFVRLLKRERIDVVQTHDFYSNIFGMTGAKLARVPMRIAAKRETGMRSSTQRFIERRAFSFADTIVVNSEKVKGYLVGSGVPGRKCEVIYNGLDRGRFEVDLADRVTLLGEFGLPKTLRFVTILANLRDRVKNHHMFLRAAAMVAEEVKDAGFVLAGEGELLDEMKREADGLGIGDRVFFLGRCTRVPELLAASDIGVLTSESEGFSNSIIEYMAAGKPVVATNVGGAAEAVANGETGFLVASNDHKALAERLCILLRDPANSRKMGLAGKARVTEKFSTETQLRKTLAIYDRLAARGEGSR